MKFRFNLVHLARLSFRSIFSLPTSELVQTQTFISHFSTNRQEHCKLLVNFLENCETMINILEEHLLNFEVGEVAAARLSLRHTAPSRSPARLAAVAARAPSLCAI